MKTKVSLISLIIFTLVIPRFSFAQNYQDSLIDAIRNMNVSGVKKALDSGADPNKLTSYGASPLVQAAWTNNLEIIHLLTDKGADIHLNTDFGCPLFAASAQGAMEAARFFIENKADLNCRDKSGKTPLMIAIYNGHPDIAKLLTASGADVNMKGEADWTALFFAVMRGDIESVRNLLKAGAEVNVKANDGETPLQRAAALDYSDIISLLKEAGAQ